MGNIWKMFTGLKQEMSEMERLFSPSNKDLRRLVFYAESPIFYRYYEDYINYIKANSNLSIAYLCSDPDDPMFSQKDDRVVPFYFKNVLTAVFNKLDSKVLVMGTPDLNHGAIKRVSGCHHVYAFRGVCSTHLSFRFGALDHYDSILCVGQYQIDELRKAEQLYGTKPKELVLTGYPNLERIWREHQACLSVPQEKHTQPICLIAPSWAPLNPESSIMDSCIESIINVLAGKPFTVWIRPHPEYLKRFPKKITALEKLCAATTNVSLQLNLGSMACLHQADLLVTDQSSISIDFALGTERPVVFIDTPTRIDNPRYRELGLEPVELTFRNELGARLAPEQMGQLPALLQKLIKEGESFKARVPALRDKLTANWQKAAAIGGSHIIKLCE